jgi:hypothetical protein
MMGGPARGRSLFRAPAGNGKEKPMPEHPANRALRSELYKAVIETMKAYGATAAAAGVSQLESASTMISVALFAAIDVHAGTFQRDMEQTKNELIHDIEVGIAALQRAGVR